MNETPQSVTDRNLHNENIQEIRVTTLMVIIVALSVVAYGWLVYIVWPFMGRENPPAAWIGCLVLLVGITISYTQRSRNVTRAYWVMVGSVYSGIVFAFIAYQLPILTYLFILPILISSVFYNPRNIIVMVVVTVGAVIHLNKFYLGEAAVSPETLSQAGLMVFAGIASWLSARNLYEALEWVRAGYDDAHKNEQMVRQQQSELLRTLKALDISTHQMDRLNHFLMIERDRAEQASRIKQRFAQNISHELRTPLSIIVGFSELMIHSPEYYSVPLPQQYLRDLATIYRNARHLQSMTNDVLELAGIDAAQVSLFLEKVEPAELAQDAVSTIRSLVENRGLTLDLEIQPGLPQVWLDPTRIRQVLFNLLNNATRFTDRGGITIRVTADEREVCYSVQDTGVGIPAEALSRIFEEFEQVRQTGENRGGTGLGLAISQRFVQMHSGRIWVESEPNKGSTFSFALPISGRNYSGLYKTMAERQQQVRQVEKNDKTSVLVAITGSAAVAGFLSRRISVGRVVTLQNVETAAAALEKILPQAVIVDTSWEPAQTVDWDQALAEAGLEIPVVYCGLSPDNQIKKQLNSEAYLIKPVKQRDILDTLRRFGSDVHKILVVDDDRDFVQFMTRLLGNQLVLKYRVLTAYNGVEALEMFRYHHPDLVFIDLMMPGMGGEEVIRQMMMIEAEQPTDAAPNPHPQAENEWEEDLERWEDDQIGEWEELANNQPITSEDQNISGQLPESREEQGLANEHKTTPGDPPQANCHTRFVIVSGNIETEGMQKIPGQVIIHSRGGLLPGHVIRLLNDLLGEYDEESS